MRLMFTTLCVVACGAEPPPVLPAPDPLVGVWAFDPQGEPMKSMPDSAPATAADRASVDLAVQAARKPVMTVTPQQLQVAGDEGVITSTWRLETISDGTQLLSTTRVTAEGEPPGAQHAVVLRWTSPDRVRVEAPSGPPVDLARQPQLR
jgi:hypothetical protein